MNFIKSFMLYRKRIGIRLLNIRPLRLMLCRLLFGRDKRGPFNVDGATRLAILIHSFDGYKRFQVPCMHFFREYSSCMEDAYLAIEKIRLPQFENLKVIFTGAGSFSKRMCLALQCLRKRGYTHVLYLQEDMWINGVLDVNLLKDLARRIDSARVMSLKLAHESCWPPEHSSIVEENGQMELGCDFPEFVHFGEYAIPVSHHGSLYEIRFLLKTLGVARLLGFNSPIEHEDLCGRLLKGSVRKEEGGREPVKIGIWKKCPLIKYIHASSIGKLTREAEEVLEKEDLMHLYDPSMPGEVFPISR